MEFNNEHCGKAWPHNEHEWLPDYPHALWKTCPGSDERGKRSIPSIRSVELKAAKGKEA